MSRKLAGRFILDKKQIKIVDFIMTMGRVDGSDVCDVLDPREEENLTEENRDISSDDANGSTQENGANGEDGTEDSSRENGANEETHLNPSQEGNSYVQENGTGGGLNKNSVESV